MLPDLCLDWEPTDMSETAIRIENLSKLYLLGEAERKHESLAAELGNMLSAPVRNFRRLQRLDTSRAVANGNADSPDLLWAIKDVSFEVKRGEVLGIIGRNGAGKSTLLKVLSRITEPTSGRVQFWGRMASLLEVGTGFHPDLTGRENVYLNGTILGMTKREIDRKFDEIVEFSGVERFLDTPVKRYSSGMKVRLGFAVAAHLDPDILIVDEVLAVGDAEFQRKCLGKMREVVGNGDRTVLFVSHSMAAVESLCDRVAIMGSGQLKAVGDTLDMIQQYMNDLPGRSGRPVGEREDRQGDGRVVCTDVWVEDASGNRTDQVRSGQDVRICLQFRVSNPTALPLEFGIGIYDVYRACVLRLSTEYVPAGNQLDRSVREGVAVCEVPRLALPPGEFWINTSLIAADGGRCDRVEQAKYFDVHPGDYYGTGRLPQGSTSRALMDHAWHLEEMRSGKAVEAIERVVR
jgi:lipopolysaccharide transport system ATP-binding protein